MKLVLRYIPIEVWVDVFVFPWISRKKLGKIVHKFRNRKFAEYLQFYLHDWGKRTLNPLHLDIIMSDIPRTPMSPNIRFFEHITIWHFDSEALAFLHQISSLFIFNQVNLRLDDHKPREDLTNLRPVLDHLAPMLNGIHSIHVRPTSIPLVEQYFTPKLPQLKMLTIDFGWRLADQAAIQTGINFGMNWLASAGQLGEFTLLKVISYHNPEIVRQFFESIQQQFLTAKSACTFAIQFNGIFGCLMAESHMENNLGEQLHGEYNEHWTFQINRHQPNGGTALQEWVEETVGKSYKSSVIQLADNLTIGPIAANVDTKEVDDGGAEDERPSTSKKPKLTQ